MIAPRLIGARKAKGLSQQELADCVGVALRTIQNWEGGHTQPGPTDLRKLSETLDKTIPYLIGQSDESERPPPEELREVAPPNEATLWKRRAIAAEKQLHNLRSMLRLAMDISGGTPTRDISSDVATEMGKQLAEMEEAAKKKLAEQTQVLPSKSPSGARTGESSHGASQDYIEPHDPKKNH